MKADHPEQAPKAPQAKASEIATFEGELERVTARLARAHGQLLRATLAEREREERERISELQKRQAEARAKLRQQAERTAAVLAGERQKVKELTEERARRTTQERERVATLQAKHAADASKLKGQLEKATARLATAQEQVKALRATLAEREREDRERVSELQKRQAEVRSQLQEQLQRSAALLAGEREKVKKLIEERERRTTQERERLATLRAKHSAQAAKLKGQLEKATARLASAQEEVKALRAMLAEREREQRERLAGLQTRHAEALSKLRQQGQRTAALLAGEQKKVKELTADGARRAEEERERLATLRATHSAEAAELQAQLARAVEHGAAQEEQARTLRVELAEREHRDKGRSRAGSRRRASAGASRSADGRAPAPAVDPPVVLLASAGSSGSHLAAVLLARRKPFFTGPEADLASRPDLFDPASFDLALLKGLLRQEPYFRPSERPDGKSFHVAPPRVLTNAESYGVDGVAVKLELIEKAADWPAMIRYLHARLVASRAIAADDVLIDHSPSCAVSLEAALGAIPKLKVVHLVRDPRDAVASMMARRKVAPQFASLGLYENLALTAEQWAFLTAAALRAADQPGYIRVSYEDLVRRPDEMTEHLCGQLGFPDAQARAKGPLLVGPMDKQLGWTSSPTAKVTDKSIGRFKRDLSARQLKRLTDMRFEFPELGQEVSMKELIERFAATEAATKPARPRRAAPRRRARAASGS